MLDHLKIYTLIYIISIINKLKKFSNSYEKSHRLYYKYQSGSTQIHGQTLGSSQTLLNNPTWNNFPSNADISKYKRLKFYITPSKHTIGLSTNNITGAVIAEVSLIDAQIRSDITTYYSGSGIGFCINNDDRFMVVPVIVANNNGVWQYAFSTISLYDVTGTHVTDSWIYEIDGFYDDADDVGSNIVASGLPQVSASDNGKILMVVNGQ